MSDQGAHVATDQETALYDALTIGDHDAIEQMREDASDAEQFEVDYAYAHAHYQADHEAPEDEREQATAEVVEAENDEAARNEEIILAEEEVDAEVVSDLTYGQVANDLRNQCKVSDAEVVDE